MGGAVGHESQGTRAVGHGVQGQALLAALHLQPDGRLGMGGDGFAHRGVEREGHVADGEDLVAFLQPRQRRTAPVVDGGHFAGKEQREGTAHAFVDEDLAEFFLEAHAGDLAVAQDVDLGHGLVEALHAQVAEVRELLAVVSEDAVAVLEPDGFQGRVDVDRVFVGQFGFTPNKQDAAVDDEAQDQIHDDAPEHDDQALPRGLGSKLPRLGGLGHLFRIHALVNHSGNLHVAAQGKPADAPFRVSDLFLEQGKARVHEEVELLHLCLEGAGGPVVPQFVEDDQDGKAQKELGCFDECNHESGVEALRTKVRASARGLRGIHAPLLTTI